MFVNIPLSVQSRVRVYVPQHEFCSLFFCPEYGCMALNMTCAEVVLILLNYCVYEHYHFLSRVDICMHEPHHVQCFCGWFNVIIK